MMRRKKKAAAHMKAVAQAFDEALFASRKCSPEEAERGDAVRSLCPCHVGWEVFEGHVVEVLHALKDRSRGVRAGALHVLGDAARMQHVGEIDYYVQEAEERLRRKRSSRFRPGENGDEEKKINRLRWRARRRIKADG
jgi:hypothetical protein